MRFSPISLANIRCVSEASSGRFAWIYSGTPPPAAYSISMALKVLGARPQAPACDALATQNLGATGPSTDHTVLALSDFMAGCVVHSSIQEGDPKRLVYVNLFNMFAQDTWQVTKKLNINYGLRWDYSGPPHTGNQDLSVFDPTAPNGLAVAGKDVANVYQQDWKQFNPRLGFAYQPKQDGGLVIRGGFGLYSDAPYLIPFFNLHGQPNGGAAGLQYNPAGTKQVAVPTVNSFVIAQNQPISLPSTRRSPARVSSASTRSTRITEPPARPVITSMCSTPLGELP